MKSKFGFVWKTFKLGARLQENFNPIFSTFCEKFLEKILQNVMRILFPKFHFSSFICFCKPSSHFLGPTPLNLENPSYVPKTLYSVPDALVQSPDETIEVKKSSNETTEVMKESLDGKKEVKFFPRSSLKKPPLEAGPLKEAEKGKVLWKDNLGKELVEIKEFEPSEFGDSDYEGESNRGCVCVIQ